jgi:8-oxo-dGTP pyrophosphatase MutT (NUDIX family)
VLLLNERDEWELPGGRLERGEDPVACLKREFAQELGAKIVADGILDCWLYQVLPEKRCRSHLHSGPRRPAEVPGQSVAPEVRRLRGRRAPPGFGNAGRLPPFDPSLRGATRLLLG